MKKIFIFMLVAAFVITSNMTAFAVETSPSEASSSTVKSEQPEKVEQPEDTEEVEQPEDTEEVEQPEAPEAPEQPEEEEIDIEENADINFDSSSDELKVTLSEEKYLELKNKDMSESDKKSSLIKEAEGLKDSKNPKDLIKLALINKSLGNIESALEYANQALAADPGNQKALLILAELAKKNGNIGEARIRLEEALKKRPNAKVNALLANIEEDEGNVTGAVDRLEKAVKMEPGDVDLYKKLGNLYKKEGNDEIKVFVQGDKPAFDVKPIIKSGRTLVPIRAIAESLKADVSWDSVTSTAVIKKGDIVVELRLGFDEATVNGKTVKLDVPAVVINGRILIPLRFLSESFNATVGYDSATRIITVTTQ